MQFQIIKKVAPTLENIQLGRNPEQGIRKLVERLPRDSLFATLPKQFGQQCEALPNEIVKEPHHNVNSQCKALPIEIVKEPNHNARSAPQCCSFKG